jgi:hypothetical protein
MSKPMDDQIKNAAARAVLDQTVLPDVFLHITPKPDACEHDFQGWRDFPDGNGGERVCAKCGMGAMAHSLSLDF